jgi:hypothetical protein
MNAIVEKALLLKLSQLSAPQLAEVEGFIESLATKTVAGSEAVDSGHASPISDPAFGIWRDRKDLGDVDAFVRGLRASRFSADGSSVVTQK